jgi:hypothetical protein
VRFLSPRLRRDLMGELRFTPVEAASGDGIDVASLELDAADRAAIDVLRTGAGLDLLAGLQRGWAWATPPATRSRPPAARWCCGRRGPTGRRWWRPAAG